MLSGISVININMPEAVYNAKVLVTTAGTRVQLTSDVTRIKSGITIKALDTNTGLTYVGDSSVAAANGYQLAAGETSFFEVKNRSLIYIDSAENGDGVTYITSGAVSIVPVVTSVSPIGGLPNDTKTITISGNNFIGVSSVTIDSNPCTSINVTSVTSLTVEVPVGTVGAKTVEVVGVGGSGSLASGYTYEDAPTVTSITPNTGMDTAETPVAIVGDNFAITPFIVSVKIGGADCTSIVVVDNNNITAVTPTGTAGAQDVVVTTLSGAGTLAGGFTYISFVPSGISGTLLWIDPDDATTWTGVTAIEDKVSSASFAHSGSAVTRALVVDSVVGALGNGKYFIHADIATNYGSANFAHTPSGSPLNDAAVGGVGEEWLWYYVIWNDSGSDWQKGPRAYRGTDGKSACDAQSVHDQPDPDDYVRLHIDLEWITTGSNLLSPTLKTYNTPPWIDPTGAVVAYYLQSYDDGGTMKIRLGFNGGVSWGIDWTHGGTADTPDAADNKWTLRLANWQNANPMALGETGFVRGAVSAGDLTDLHTYLKAKWDLTDS